jgi:uncharacterized MAPEG superfamily protein
MSIELLTLLACAMLCLALPFIYSPLYARQVGLGALAGNREDAPAPTGMAGRALRAHRNLLENLVPYGAAVLSAHALGVSNSYTVAAAIVFLSARVLHAFSYIAGITGLRSLAWQVGVLATIVMAVQAFPH